MSKMNRPEYIINTESTRFLCLGGGEEQPEAHKGTMDFLTEKGCTNPHAAKATKIIKLGDLFLWGITFNPPWYEDKGQTQIEVKDGKWMMGDGSLPLVPFWVKIRDVSTEHLVRYHLTGKRTFELWMEGAYDGSMRF